MEDYPVQVEIESSDKYSIIDCAQHPPWAMDMVIILFETHNVKNKNLRERVFRNYLVMNHMLIRLLNRWRIIIYSLAHIRGKIHVWRRI